MSTKLRESEAERGKAFYRKNGAEIAEAYKEAGSWGGALRLILQEEAEPEEFLDELEHKAGEARQALAEQGLPSEPIDKIVEEALEAEQDELPSWYMDCIFWAALIDLIEEGKGSPIADAKELLEITGLSEYGLEELGKWLIIGREWKYQNALTGALEGGGKFADLLKIDPSAFNLPEEWDSPDPGLDPGRVNKERAIAEAICYLYWLLEFDYMRPSPRAVAEATGAPYPLILEALGEFHKNGL